MTTRRTGKKVTLDDLAKETLPEGVNEAIDRYEMRMGVKAAKRKRPGLRLVPRKQSKVER